MYPVADYLMDRGYLDFTRLHRLQAAGAFFVTRINTTTSYYVVGSRPVVAEGGLRCDQRIRLNSKRYRRGYPEDLRINSFFDPEARKRLVFLPNQLALDALTVALIAERLNVSVRRGTPYRVSKGSCRLGAWD